MIYLDNAATTAMFESSVDVYKEYACNKFYNPSASYEIGLKVLHEIENAKNILLEKLGAKKGNIIFTSGATESNNLAILGSKRNGKWEYVFSLGEHPSVYNVAKELEKQGFVVHYVGLSANGEVNYEELQKVLNEKTRLISVMHASNETGAINDLKKIDMIRKKYAPNALIHADGVQAFCKLEYNLDDLGVDFYTISAHKFHGPKGVGALYVKNINSLKSIFFGGGQENGFRSGTENVAGIMSTIDAMGKIDVKEKFIEVQKLYNTMIDILSKDCNVSFIKTNNPYVISVGFEGVNGETLMRALQNYGVIVGIGSACSTKKSGNRILESIGLNKEEVKSHIRISFDSSNSIEEIKEAGEIILKVYREIWEKVR